MLCACLDQAAHEVRRRQRRAHETGRQHHAIGRDVSEAGLSQRRGKRLGRLRKDDPHARRIEFRAERRGRADRDEPPAEHRHAIGDAFDFIEIVCAQQDGPALPAKTKYQVAHVARALGIET